MKKIRKNRSFFISPHGKQEIFHASKEEFLRKQEVLKIGNLLPHGNQRFPSHPILPNWRHSKLKILKMNNKGIFNNITNLVLWIVALLIILGAIYFLYKSLTG